MKIRLARKVLYRLWSMGKFYRDTTIERALHRQSKWERVLRASYGPSPISRCAPVFATYHMLVKAHTRIVLGAFDASPVILDMRALIRSDGS